LKVDNGLIGEGRELKDFGNKYYSSHFPVSHPSIPGIYRSPFFDQDNQGRDGELR